MKFSLVFLMVTILFFVAPGFSFQRIDYSQGMNRNVCKELKNNVLVYFIFVDSKETSPWTEFDIQSTIDSMEVAISWIETQASYSGIQLNLISDYYIGTEYTPVRKNLPFGTVYNSATSPNLKKGLDELNKWADAIAKRAGSEVEIAEKDGIPEIQNPKNKERLIAHLRDEKKVESVALLYMVNNYYRSDVSLAVNTMNTEDVEFAIVSYKYPAVISQNILNLFGAADLSRSIYRRDEKKIKLAGEFFPNDIMQDVYGRNINSLEIGEFTRYLIGWSPTLDPKYQTLLTDKIMNY